MILQRIADSLRKQDWTSVTIEVLIVVLGVFIGLQVNDWGAEQAAQRRGLSASFTTLRAIFESNATSSPITTP